MNACRGQYFGSGIIQSTIDAALPEHFPSMYETPWTWQSQVTRANTYISITSLLLIYNSGSLFRLADNMLSLGIPIAILVHVLVAPYSEVEESFNLQAIHDILHYVILYP